MIFDLNKNAINEKYKLMAQTIIPRPIAWVVTQNDTVVNIAPFSFFMGLSHNPATVMISIAHKSDGSLKDTLANIRKNGLCTICMVDETNLEKMHFSSKELDRDLSEAEMFDIKTKKLFNEFPPMIEDVSCAYFCDFNQEIDLGGGDNIPIVLNVKQIFVKDDAIKDKQRMTIEFNPVARMGKSYSFLAEDIKPPVIP